MIRAIQNIKAFGVFNDFRWPSGLPEFKQFNLIYGWNYSGKTTLSRIFRCFEQGQSHVDFADAQVQLKSEDGTIYDLAAPHAAPVFRVFNSDFIHDNLSFEVGDAKPILVLGAEDIAKQNELKAKTAERELISSQRNADLASRDEIESGLRKALTNCARDWVKIPLSVPNYDKTNFLPNVKDCAANPAGYLLDDANLGQNRSTFLSTDKKAALSLIDKSPSSITEINKKTAAILARIVTANIPIPRLKDNPIIESWVKTGISLHKAQTTCQFCGQRLPSDLMARLAEHFSADYENLMSELETLLREIRDAEKEGIFSDYSKGDFYQALQERFSVEKRQLDSLLTTRGSVLATLEKAVIAKQTQAFSNVKCPIVDDPTEKIVSAIESINQTITEHNSRSREFDKNRQEAFRKLEKHYAALFAKNHEYKKLTQQITDIDSAIAKQNATVKKLDKEILTLEQAISEASKGAGQINDLLTAYFGKNDLQIEVSDDKRFQIIRRGVVAKNLSEGEKTAIAFAYFITRVQDGRHPLADTSVVIDDPISSLDANHLFNTYALIKTQLATCHQLFVATHSFEFYNLIREWVADDEGQELAKKPQAQWKKWSMFLLKRTDNAQAILKEIPRELLKFKSEYHYLFSELYHFDNDDTDDFDCLLSLPNVVRRFMEAFGGIMIPLSTGLKKKMPRLFPDEIERERVWKFINHYSHNTTISRSLTIPDTSECKAVVRACLKAIQSWNSDYFNDLKAEVASESSKA